MARRLGIILTTTVVALLVMSDGAWACRYMNRLINRCGHRRVCCCITLQPSCCQPATLPACCQPATGEMKPAEGAVKVEVKVVPPAINPPSPPVPEVTAPPAPKKPETPAEVKPEIKPEPKTEIQPPKIGPVEVPAEPRAIETGDQPNRTGQAR